ncbi:hypothetical protein [Paenarthrobacter sp. UW852]
MFSCVISHTWLNFRGRRRPVPFVRKGTGRRRTSGMNRKAMPCVQATSWW